MKKIKHLFSPRYMVVWLSIVVLIIAVPKLTEPSMDKRYAIVTMMSVDESDDGQIEMVVNTLSPSTTNSEQEQYFSATGKTLGTAVENLSIMIGKQVVFSQCEIMAFGEKMAETGILGTLDFMTRMKKISRNAVLIVFTGDIVDFMDAVNTLEKDKNIKLKDAINFDKRYVLADNSDIDTFYRDYFSDNSQGILPKLKVSSEKQLEAIEVASMSESNSGQSSSESQEKKYIVNDGTSSMFRNGKFIFDINPEMMKKINMYIDNGFDSLVTVEHVNDEIYKNATVVFNVSESEVFKRPSFENGKPKYIVDINLRVYIEQVVQEQQGENFMQRNKVFLNDNVLNLLKEKIKSDMMSVVDFCRENKIDLIEAYDKFNALSYKKFQNYLKKVGKENYLDEIDVKINVNIASAY